MRHLTLSPEAREQIERLAEIPWGFWVAIVIGALIGGLLAWLTEHAPYDPYADRDVSQLDQWDGRGEYQSAQGGDRR